MKDGWKKTGRRRISKTLIRFIDFIEHKKWRREFSLWNHSPILQMRAYTHSIDSFKTFFPFQFWTELNACYQINFIHSHLEHIYNVSWINCACISRFGGEKRTSDQTKLPVIIEPVNNGNWNFGLGCVCELEWKMICKLCRCTLHYS